MQFLGNPPSNDNGLAGDAEGALEGIAGSEEEALDTEDQEAIVF